MKPGVLHESCTRALAGLPKISLLERGIHALAATEKGKHNGRSVDAYARSVGRPITTVRMETYAAEVAQIVSRPMISKLMGCTGHLAEIHAAPQACWPALVERLVNDKWTVAQAEAAVKEVLATKPQRGYEDLFPVAELQQRMAAGDDPGETMRLSVRAIERARADIRDVQFSVEAYLKRFDHWLAEHGPWDSEAVIKCRAMRRFL